MNRPPDPTTDAPLYPRYRPVYYSGHTLLVQRIYGIWCWSVEFPDGSGIDGWTFSKRGAYRAAFNMVPR